MNKAKHEATCTEISNTLLQHFDEGSLDDLPGDLRAHLDACPDCRRELAELRKLQQGLLRLPVPQPAEEYWTNFLPRLRQRMEQTIPLWRRRDPAWIPSLGLTLLFAVLLLSSPTRMAPPTWFQPQLLQPSEAVTFGNDNLTDQDWENLAEIAQSQDIFELYLDDSESYLVQRLSGSYPYASDDPIDRLTALEDEAVQTILDKLKTTSVIRS